MRNWVALLEDIGIGELVPAYYARFRPAVLDGTAFFLNGLSETRLVAVLADQASLKDDAGPAERLVTIARHSPVLHKLGQVLARDRRLAPALRHHLQTLESMPAVWSVNEACDFVAREIGPLDRLGIAITEPPLAEASVAVVVPMTWREPGNPTSAARRGVFKVLKPGIEARLAEDLDLLERAGPWLDERCVRYGLPRISYESTFGEVRRLLVQEIDLSAEQSHLREAGRVFAGLSHIVVPEPFSALSTRRLTAMSRLDGRKVTDAGHLASTEREQIAAFVIEALLAVPVWSADETAVFHADPHAGNLLLMNDGRVGLLDWSLTGHLSKRTREDLTRLGLAVLCFDAAAVIAVFDDLADAPVDASALRRVVDAALDRLVQGAPLSLDWLLGLLDAAVLDAGVRIGGDLLLFRKVLHTVSGVVRDVAADVPLMDRVLVRNFLRRFTAEIPARALAQPSWRGFSTHLANTDLWQVAVQSPLAVLNAWSRLVR